MSVNEVRYGSKVLIRDHSELDGRQGVVIKISDTHVADVLLDKEILWPVKLEELQLVS
jgi:hypothetical protein